MKRQFVFICSAGHSGSTLLSSLLGAHPSGLAVGEVQQLPKNIALDSICSCGQTISKCEFWEPLVTAFGNQIGQDLWTNPYELNLGFIRAGSEIDHRHQTWWRMLRYRLTLAQEYSHLFWKTPRVNLFSKSLIEGAQAKRDLFHFMLKSQKLGYIVDSSKHYIDALHLFWAAPNETKIIHLVRDGRAVFNSGLARGLSANAALSSWAYPSRRSLALFRKYLSEVNKIVVTYENFASNPESELRRITEFLGTEYSDEMMSFWGSASHIANGNRMRLGRGSKVNLDERWRTELSDEMKRYFERHAGNLNRRLGYGA